MRLQTAGKLLGILFLCSLLPSSPIVVRQHRSRRAKGPLVFLQGNKWGYLDATGKVVIPPQYDGADFFYEGLAVVRVGDKSGFIDFTGKFVIEPQFESASSFSDGLAYVMRKAESGLQEAYIDKSGKVAFTCERGCGYAFSEGMVADNVEVSWNCTDQQGNLAPKKRCAKRDASGWPRIIFVDRWGYRDKTGQLAIPGRLSSGLQRFSEGLAAAALYHSNLWGYVNNEGEFVIPPKFDGANAFCEGLAAVRFGDWTGYVDHAGALVIPFQLRSGGCFSEGLAGASIDGKWGFIDQSGKFVIPARFAEVQPFSEGLAAASENRKYGFIDKTGRFVIPPIFTGALTKGGPFSEGVALVEIEGKQAYIDRRGKVIAMLRQPTEPNPIEPN